SESGVTITADYYEANPDRSTPLLLLFHRAQSSRGEYREIAPKLVKSGFNCLAVDLRSGREINGVSNATHESAVKAGVRHTHADAFPDLIATAKYARKNLATGPILGWGSSYSASLALKMAGDFPGGLTAVLAFSPGEYFEKMGKSPRWIQLSAQKISNPVFITSGREEGEQWKSIAGAIKPNLLTKFLPKAEGKHGSEALFSENAGNEEYWAAVMSFLEPWSAKSN
ncbi:MAG: hypothetical protein AAGF67_05215, partial [Verrucomicrobiota bacterium]